MKKNYVSPEMEIDLFEENSGLIMALSESEGCVVYEPAPECSSGGGAIDYPEPCPYDGTIPEGPGIIQ